MREKLRTQRLYFGLFLGLAITTVGDCGATDSTPRPGRPNILWLIVEDQSVDWGCYGVSAVSTPNIDQFASDGVLFRSAFSTAPVCSTSRSCFNTGVYQTSFGGHHHRSHREGFPDYPYPLPAPTRHLADIFREAGYFTCNSDESLTRAGKEDYDFTSSSSPWDGLRWSQRKSGQPFFAQVNVRNMDHQGGFGHVDPDKVSVPPYHPDRPLTRATWAHYHERTQSYDQKVGDVLRRLKADGLEKETIVFLFGDNGRQVQRGMQFLYDGGIHVPMIVRWPGTLPAGAKSDALVSLIDLAPTSLTVANINRPQSMQGKIFLGPDAENRKFVFAARDRMDETMDRIRCVRTARYKYIRNYAVWGEPKRRPYTKWGIYREVKRQSNVYKMHNYPILALLHVLHARGELNSTQELFMVDEKPPEELYDLQDDPHEIHNLADSRSHRAVKQELENALNDWMLSVGDHGRIPEDPAISDQWYDQQLRPRNIKKTATRDGISVDATAEDYLAFWRSHFELEK